MSLLECGDPAAAGPLSERGHKHSTRQRIVRPSFSMTLQLPLAINLHVVKER